MGTTSNEALHNELNRSVDTATMYHHTTLVMKLRAFHLGKMVTHDSALFRPTTTQLSSKVLLTMAVSSDWISHDDWVRICSSASDNGKLMKARLRLSVQRWVRAETLQIWRMQRAKPKPKRTRRRTVFSALRR